MQPSALAKRLFILLFIIIIVFYFFGLGYLPLVGPDEPRYAQVAREMYLRGDFITPTLGGHTWFEKPALLYWMMIAAYSIFGVGEFAARLGPAISGVLTILAVWVLTQKIERTQIDELRGLSSWSALAAATSFGMIVFSRGATFDVVVTMTITWTLVFFLLHELAATSRNRRFLLAGFYAAMGVSLLAKGLIGIVIPLGVIGFHHLLTRKKPSRELFLSLMWGLPITLFVSALWYGPVIARHGWTFIDEFFIQHHFARYVSDKYRHPQPIYFYLPMVLIVTLPWSAFFIDSIANLRFSKNSASDPAARFKIFGASWILFPVLFFSFSGSKLPGYILPALPAAAILIGERMTRTGRGASSRWPLIATGILAVVLAAMGIYYATSSNVLSVRAAFLISLPFLAAGLFAIAFSRHATIAQLLLAIATLVTFGATLRFTAFDFAQRQSIREVLAVANSRGYTTEPIFIRRGSDRTAEFYASGRVVYGSNGEPEPLEELPQMIAEAKRRGERILVLVPVEYLDLYKKSPEFEIIAENGNLALLATKVK